MGIDAHHLGVNMARQLAYHALWDARFAQFRHELVPKVIEPEFCQAWDRFEAHFLVTLCGGLSEGPPSRPPAAHRPGRVNFGPLTVKDVVLWRVGAYGVRT